MKNKRRKFIFKGLMASILFMNFPVNSLAGTLSDDTRYETFKYSSITVHDVLEQDNVDIAIEGNTLVNIHPKYTPYLNTSSNKDGYTIETRENYIKAVGENSTLNWLYVHFGNLNINMFKPNTTYTVVFSKLKGIDYIAFHTGASTNPIANHIEVIDGQLVYVFNTYKEINSNAQALYLGLRNTAIDVEVENPMIFEGDITDNVPKEYFAGMKSVGQDDINGHKIEILLENKNLFKNEWYKELSNTEGYIISSNNPTTEFIEIKPNATYTLSQRVTRLTEIVKNQQINSCRVRYYDKNKTEIGNSSRVINTVYEKSVLGINTFKTPTNCYYIKIMFGADNGDTTPNYLLKFEEIQLEENNVKTVYKPYECYKKEIILKEPLRGVPNGVKDKVVKIGNQWFVERNCGLITTDSTWDWKKGGFTASFFAFSKIYGGSDYTINTICDNLPGVADNPSSGKHYGIATSYLGGGAIMINANPEWLSEISVNAFKAWVKTNPMTVIYQRATPTYELLNLDLSIPLYTETTYLSNNSTVPLCMEIVVDRVANRAKEYAEIAKLNPSVENIAIARMWINLMQDSILKDKFQEEVNNIIQIEDLEIEKKVASANVDLYIESLNSLSMSLSTNSIIFDDYTSTDDLEMLNAVDVVVSSSLPYDLNVYMPSGIYNADKSKTMDINVLNIKTSEESQYKSFANNSDKIVLKNNCTEGENLIHSIDLKLSGGNTYKADIYKTVLKFEAEQK